jgi:TM2 domain-containing membrane protein YozV
VAQAKKPGGGDANVAALLTWFLPGAGHAYLGRVGYGIAAFLVVNGLYFVGLQLADGMTFEYLSPELRSRFAPLLSPEAGNLGGLLWQLNHQPFGPGYPRAWPELMRLGSLLCALSGVLNACLVAQAHLAARNAKRPARLGADPAAALALAWAVPGLGHWIQGRRLRAACVFGVLVGLFALGTLLADGSNLSRERHFFYWAGQFLVGLPAIVAEFVGGGMRVTGPIPYADVGLVFGCSAGLLNVLAMIDVFAWSEAELLGLPKKTLAASGRDEDGQAGAEARA